MLVEDKDYLRYILMDNPGQRGKLNASYNKEKKIHVRYLKPDDSWTDKYYVEKELSA